MGDTEKYSELNPFYKFTILKYLKILRKAIRLPNLSFRFDRIAPL